MPNREKLAEFTDWCQRCISGDEKGQAQIFLDRLFQAFGQAGCLDVGGATEFRIRKASEDGGGTAFADYVWKPVVLIEMKKRGADLQKHYRQAFDYWTRLVPNRPRYVVLCNFDEFRVYDFDTDLDTPKDTVALKDLPDRWGPLAFLAPGTPAPTFENDRESVTRQAADVLAECFRKLVGRGVPQPEAQRFILQMLVALFAEDIRLLPKYLVAGILEECHSPTDTYDLIGGLFEAMNRPKPADGGRYKEVPYFNGGLFREPARLELHDQELVMLRQAARFDWSKVQPEVFGTLFQHSMDEKERHTYGAHFTSPADIMKIVGPTIVDPWREQIEGAKTFKRLRELRDRMQTFRVLDPACGSGNFLYIAYREMKRLEARVYERIDAEFPKFATPDQIRFSYLSAQNFYGLDVLPFAVEIAKVTMMIARKLAIDELHITEKALPLDNLDKNFIAGDALLTDQGLPAIWPKADVIIGNPPFLDARKMTLEHGRTYVAQLEKAYPDVPRRADFCTYWIRKAADHLPSCTPEDPVTGRAGLVGTQNIRNNQSRIGGLDYVVRSGTIVEAVDNQPWSGEANVHVSIANWVKSQNSAVLPKGRRLWFKVPASGVGKRNKPGQGSAAKTYQLNYRNCSSINSALSDATDVSGAKVLDVNKKPKRCFEGQQPGHEGFRLSLEERNSLKTEEDIGEIVYPYLNGTDLLTEGFATNPSFIIDFGERNLFEVAAFPKTLEIVKQKVLPDWQKNASAEQEESGKDSGEHQGRLETWWLLKRRRGELLRCLNQLSRYVVCSRVSKRPIFSFVSSAIHPDSSLSCFTFEDDFSFGILQSNAHWIWFSTKCSKLKSDFRYTPDSVFDTFPWPPNATNKQIETVAAAARNLRIVREDALKSIKGGLRALYRTLELPGANPLKDAHSTLDLAVLEAFGFSAKKDLLSQLLALNLEVAAKIEKGEDVVAPGIPPSYSKPEKLVSKDCIRPPGE